MTSLICYKRKGVDVSTGVLLRAGWEHGSVLIFDGEMTVNDPKIVASLCASFSELVAGRVVELKPAEFDKRKKSSRV
jgi:hypothetical protein